MQHFQMLHNLVTNGKICLLSKCYLHLTRLYRLYINSSLDFKLLGQIHLSPICRYQHCNSIFLAHLSLVCPRWAFVIGVFPFCASGVCYNWYLRYESPKVNKTHSCVHCTKLYKKNIQRRWFSTAALLLRQQKCQVKKVIGSPQGSCFA